MSDDTNRQIARYYQIKDDADVREAQKRLDSGKGGAYERILVEFGKSRAETALRMMPEETEEEIVKWFRLEDSM